MKKFHKVLLGSLLALFLSVGIAKAEFTSLTPFYLSDNGTNWITSVSTYELGSSTNRIAKIWATAMDTTTITIGGGAIVSIGSTIGGATEGSVLFAGASGVLAQDNSNLFWDNGNNRLGIGTATPSVPFHLRGASSNIELAYFLDSANIGFIAGTAGGVAYFSSGSGATPLAFGINGATDSIYIKTDKYVGIRQSNPTAYLHIKGQTLNDYLFRVEDTDGDMMLSIRSDMASSEGILSKYGYMSENTGSFQVAGFGATFGGDRVHLYSGPFLYTDSATSGMIMGIGANPAATNPNASALLHMNSTTKGFLPPQMKGSEAEAITSPANGLLIYCYDGDGATITSTGWWGYDSGWVKLN